MTLCRRAAGVALAVLAGGVGAVGAPGPARADVPGDDPDAVVEGGPLDEAKGDVVAIDRTARVDDGWTITRIEVVLTPVSVGAGCPTEAVRGAAPVHDDNDGGPAAPTSTTEPLSRQEARLSAVALVPACNGVYAAAVAVTADHDFFNSPDPAADDETETVGLGDLAVSLRPPDPASVTATATDDRRVAVDWEPPAASPPDVHGYLVQRATGDGPFGTIATVGADATGHTDTLARDHAGGTYRYRVLTRRPAADPDEEVTSAGGPGSVAQVTVGPGAGPPGSGASGSGAGPVGSPIGGLPSAPAGRGAGGAPASVDGGFSETLDYGDAEPGEAAADEPGVGESVLDFVGSPGTGILVPFAVAECLAVWALHLRYLARRADQL